jgi:drug/metabolite transporter (DMT)-like permease
LNNKAKTYVALVLAMIFWAISFIWFKDANKFFPPITIVFIRLLFAVILLSSYLIITKSFMKIKKGDMKLFFLLALFEPFFYFLGESFSLTLVSATVCSVMVSTIPVVATLGAWIFFKEKLRIINYAGILLSFIGVLVFLINKDGNISYNLTGLGLLVIVVLSAVGYNLILTRLIGSYSPVYIVNVQNIIGAILFLPLFLIFDFNKFINTSLTFKMFMPVLQLAAFASCGAFILFAYSVKKIGIVRANAFTNVIPIFTAFFSFLLLGENLTIQNLVGILVVIAGLFMSQMNGRRKSIDDALILTGKTA